jgi:hypothetical protein
MACLLTPEQIERTIGGLPPQGRIMLRLLTLQFHDLTPEDVDYIAADRPDPRLMAGAKSTAPVISRETLAGIADRVAHYRTIVRQRRERAWLRMECLRKQMTLDRSLSILAERLLTTRFGLEPDALEELRGHARTVIPKPLLRELTRRWEQDEASEEEYRNARLRLEYQALLRRLDRGQKRLDAAKRDLDLTSAAPLLDHEIGQIWGIPAGALAARKVKYLHQYLQALQDQIRESAPPAQEAVTAPVDLWKETFTALARKPIERSVAVYDGLERTEAELLDKLIAFAGGTMPEDVESRFWMALIQESRHNAEYGSTPYSLFGLQRLSAILDEMDTSPEGIERELLTRIAPPAKAAEGAALEEPKEAGPELGQLGEHVLRSMYGGQLPDPDTPR